MGSPSMMTFMQLPECIFDEIFSYLSFDEVSKYRLVSREWNNKCQLCLTRGFYSVEKYHALSFKSVKALLPRRESERRNHSLARHCDILTAIETRLSMLSMTFTKYMDVGLCCFIPGKVIDEIFRVLRFIKEMKNPPRAHEILQELRDISSMAMEHFDEKIVPQLKETLAFSPTYPITGGPRIGARASTAASNMISQRSTHSLSKTAFQLSVQKLRAEFIKHSIAARRIKNATSGIKKQTDKLEVALRRQRMSMNRKIAHQDAQIAELKRQIEEWDHKFTDLTAKLSKVPEPDVSLPTTRSSKRVRETCKSETEKEKSPEKKLRSK